MSAVPRPQSTSTGFEPAVRPAGSSLRTRTYIRLRAILLLALRKPHLTHCTPKDRSNILALALPVSTLARSDVMDARRGRTPGRASSGEDQADGGQWPSRSS